MVKTKKLLNKISAVLISAIMAVAAVAAVPTALCSAAAAANTIQVNGTQVSVGQNITYTLKMQSKTTVAALNMTINYDKDSLELDKDAVSMPFLTTAVCNPNNDGTIVFNEVEAVKGIDFSKEQTIISATFKVKDNAKDCNIEAVMTEIIDMDLNNMTDSDYTLTQTAEEGTLPQSEIATPGDGLNQLSSEETAETGSTFDLSTQAIVIICLAAVLVVLAVITVIIKIRNKKNTQ